MHTEMRHLDYGILHLVKLLVVPGDSQDLYFFTLLSLHGVSEHTMTVLVPW